MAATEFEWMWVVALLIALEVVLPRAAACVIVHDSV